MELNKIYNNTYDILNEIGKISAPIFASILLFMYAFIMISVIVGILGFGNFNITSCGTTIDQMYMLLLLGLLPTIMYLNVSLVEKYDNYSVLFGLLMSIQLVKMSFKWITQNWTISTSEISILPIDVKTI